MRGRGDPVTSQRNSTRPPGAIYVVRGDKTALGGAVTTTNTVNFSRAGLHLKRRTLGLPLPSNFGVEYSAE